jgi:hypothetical protein
MVGLCDSELSMLVDEGFCGGDAGLKKSAGSETAHFICRQGSPLFSKQPGMAVRLPSQEYADC